ncbi:exportin-6 isoform X2 [Onthophagus taurus]|uniref:exportin-6 isoform X2 n=1 Tax=Onthophagus taurus TaxID=166361 RepID=UPI000C209CDB|nr:exportin-6 isoform X2 [Onthophagus taurus]
MAMNEKSALNALEKLMEEFFSPGTSNVRKRDIEEQLTSFGCQGDNWMYCVYFLNNTTSQYVTMYALTTIESVICRMWNKIEWECKEEIKHRLYGFYVEQDENSPHFIRNKLAKLMVDIAKIDWPHFYHNFFTHILVLLKSDKAQLLGLVLLRTSSEEMMNERCDVSSSRKDELKRLLQINIPEVFQLLISILHNLGTKPRHKATATPPPSPTQPNPTNLSITPQITSTKFRPDSKAIIREALAATQHIFSWVPLTLIPTDIIGAIFHFTHISSYAQDDDDMCLLAISTLNELLYRKCVPLSSSPLFIQLYHNTIQLLKDVTCTMGGRIETLSFDFVGKLAEMLCLIMEQHLWRLELEPGFSAIELLSLLFQLTIQLPQLPCYLRCLSVWATFMKQMKPQNAHRYSEAVQSLISAVLNKMQFIYNSPQLNGLTEIKDDNDQSEFDLFIKNSIEIIAMVAEHAPLLTFNEVLIPWKNANDIYTMLQGVVNRVSCTISLQSTEYHRLHCVLRDLSTLTQTLARLSTLFIEHGNEFMSTSTIADNLISKTIESASFARYFRFYHLKVNDERLINDFIEVQSQLLAALKTWLIWLSTNSEKSLNKFDKQLIELALYHLKSAHEEPEKVCHAAAHLFLSLSSAIFPPNLISIPEIVEFIQFAPTSRYYKKETSKVLNSACCNILVRPWGDLSQSDFQKRTLLINSYFNGLTREFHDLPPQCVDEVKINEIIGNVLPILSNLVEFCNGFQSQSKKLLYMGLKGSIDHSLLLFPLYSRFSEASNHILVFFLNVLNVLQQQMGPEVIKRAIEIFLEVAISEQQSKNLSSLEKLLQILQLIIEAPGNTYKTFLPGILQLCLHNVCPVILNQPNEHPEIFVVLLNLLHSILFYRWNYFFISQVRLGHSPGCSDTVQGPDKTQQPDQLLTILQVFGQALLQSDINVFRTSLTSLENLNNKWKLYHKDLFKEHLLPHFLKVLMFSPINKTHDLLTDDIQAAIYNMALVSFGCFFTTFLQSFLALVSGLTDAQREELKVSFKHDTDMPSFIQNLQRFINDVCCYRMCSVSSNSVVS